MNKKKSMWKIQTMNIAIKIRGLLLKEEEILDGKNVRRPYYLINKKRNKGKNNQSIQANFPKECCIWEY